MQFYQIKLATDILRQPSYLQGEISHCQSFIIKALGVSSQSIGLRIESLKSCIYNSRGLNYNFVTAAVNNE